MSTGEEERIARSVALEKTYVHDVYDHMSALQYPEHKNTTPWPKVKNFLNDLEPGSIVCDVGCGNGKYLKVNPSIFKIGSDRCHKLTQIAKDDDNEVLLCDNLTLPFRDESFDAVLSIAVIHHFATKERRVSALRELARVLRIGGRLMITVWAMEQKDRKFETQDVLVQWHHPRYFRSPSFEFSTTTTTTSEEEYSLQCRIPQPHLSDDTDSNFSRSSSLRQEGRPARSRLRLFQSLRSIRTSPSSSSLSSPNETCYSFVKKALQKLSRSNKKEKHRSRAWFLESWASFAKDDHVPATRYDPEGCEEESSIQDLPIELRRMEHEGENFPTDKDLYEQLLDVGLSQKSMSLSDIQSQLQPQMSVLLESPASATRSRSSIVAEDEENYKSITVETLRDIDTLKPKLVKQKKSICEEQYDQEYYDEERDQPTDMKPSEKRELPAFVVQKQKSMIEEFMSYKRMKEKEEVRQNIKKQISLHEASRRQKQQERRKEEQRQDQISFTVLYQHSKAQWGSIRDMLISKKEAKRYFFKSGLVKILQNITGQESSTTSEEGVAQAGVSSGFRISHSEDMAEDLLYDGSYLPEYTQEENSDSSRDNSLLSDTSIDSEDSIISVIERVIPKPEQSPSSTLLTSPGLFSSKMPLTGVLSHPSSPKISQVMQYPASKAKALSLPASPRTWVLSPNIRQTFRMPPITQLSSNGTSVPATIRGPNGHIVASGNGNGNVLFIRDSNGGVTNNNNMLKPTFVEDEPVLKLTPIREVTAARLKSFSDKEMVLLSQKLTKLSTKETEPRGADVCEGHDTNSKLNADDEQSLIKSENSSRKSKIGSAAQSTFALVKKLPSNIPALKLSPQSRLHSFEIFNPETEDIDTDSSTGTGASTPDSVGSVISVRIENSNGTPVTELELPELPDNEQRLQSDECKTQECSISSLPEASINFNVKEGKPSHITVSNAKQHLFTEEPMQPQEQTSTFTTIKNISPFCSRLPGTSSLEEKSTTKNAKITGDIRKSPSNFKRKESIKVFKKYPSLSKSPENETWDKECRQYIVDLAENLSERLLAEIDRYKERNVIEKDLVTHRELDHHVDPYLTKLSEELSHVSKLTKELSADLDVAGSPTNGISNDELVTKRINCSKDICDVENMQILETIQQQSKMEEHDEDDLSLSNLIVKDDRIISGLMYSSDPSTDAESPGSISGWLDSRRNTIESGYSRTATGDKSEDDCRASISNIHYESASKLSSSETRSYARLSIESTDMTDVSEKAVSVSSEDSMSKRDRTQTETISGLSVESDICDLDKSLDTSKSTEYSSAAGGPASSTKQYASSMKYSVSQASLLRPGESVESSEAGDFSDRTGSVSDYSRQNTESRSVITQSSASLASWSDCSKDIRFADRRTARCDGRSSSEETNPRAILTRQQAETQEPSEVKMTSTGTSLSGSTSQDSLTSESTGGSIMFHRYYHVFREGELDALIDEFVENLHIISSYYDHTNWCIIAEKVRVWTI